MKTRLTILCFLIVTCCACSGETKSVTKNESVYSVLAHGTDEDIDKVIYRNGQMTQDATRVCTGILTQHFRAPSKDGRLIEKGVSEAGEFSLVTILPSWKPDIESNYLPLIVKNAKGDFAIAGVVTPFNDLAPHLDEHDSDISKLTAQWIARIARLNRN